MIRVTREAAQQIRDAAAMREADKMGLRVAAKRAPDGSIEYGMGFDAERENDIEVFTEGVTVLVSPHSKSLLEGLVVDYVELTPGTFEFIFINPNDSGVAPTLASKQADESAVGRPPDTHNE